MTDVLPLHPPPFHSLHLLLHPFLFFLSPIMCLFVWGSVFVCVGL